MTPRRVAKVILVVSSPSYKIFFAANISFLVSPRMFSSIYFLRILYLELGDLFFWKVRYNSILSNKITLIEYLTAKSYY